jgi:transposase
MTKHLVVHQAQSLTNDKMIAQSLNVSSTTVNRQLDMMIDVKRLKLPDVLSLDEFKKTNQGYGKYAFIMTDPVNRKIVDIFYTSSNRYGDYHL